MKLSAALTTLTLVFSANAFAQNIRLPETDTTVILTQVQSTGHFLRVLGKTTSLDKVGTSLRPMSLACGAGWDLKGKDLRFSIDGVAEVSSANTDDVLAEQKFKSHEECQVALDNIKNILGDGKAHIELTLSNMGVVEGSKKRQYNSIEYREISK